MKYKCLVLDHDDTVVASEGSVNYPSFLLMLEKMRPNDRVMPLDEFAKLCLEPGFEAILRDYYHLNDEEMEEEFQMWLSYSANHVPPAFPGMKEIVLRQKQEGGLVCVVSHSSRANILRDYRIHFGTEPDLVFSWEDPVEHRKPLPYPLHAIMERWNLEPDELLMVDDLKPGVDMAKAAGVPVAYAGWGRTNMPEITEKMSKWCDYAFVSTKDMENFLFGNK